MNERIQQLAEQAKLFTGWPNGETEYQKFAELIIRECIDIVKPTQHHEAFAQGYLGDVDGLELLDGKVKQIQKHFGVN